jgi:hypothetical protein
MVNATYSSSKPKSSDRTWSLMRNAIDAPTNAPVAVNSSSVIPSRRFARWRSRKTPAAALLVMITQISETPTASRSGSPNPSVSSGTISTPPPRPSREPNAPAATPPPIISSPVSISGGVGYGRLAASPGLHAVTQGRRCCGAYGRRAT